MKDNHTQLALSIFVLFLISMSVISLDCFEGEDIHIQLIDVEDIEEWKGQEIILDERIVVRGSLLIEDSELYIKASEGGEIIVEDGGNLRVINSKIQPYYMRYYNSISIDLYEGYNILSFPFHQENDSIREVMKPLEGYYDSVWYNDSDDGWLTFRPDREKNNLEYITPDMGVAVNIIDETLFETQGFQPKRSVFELQQGANLISYPDKEEKTVSTVFSDIMQHVESVSTEISGEKIYLSQNDIMTPGRGYWVTVDENCELEFHNDLGLTEEEALEFEKNKGTKIHYEQGSSGTIRGSTLRALGDSQENPGLILESDAVSIDNSKFQDNYNDITIRSASPDIRCSTFENSKEGSIISHDSSFNAENNDFTDSEAYSFKIEGGSPSLTENRIKDNEGIYIVDSNIHLLSNEFRDTISHGIQIHRGTLLIEENTFIGNPRAIRMDSSKVSIISNTFQSNLISIHGYGWFTSIEDNMFKDDGHAILIQGGSGTIYNNEIWNAASFGIGIEESINMSIINNRVSDSSLGMRLSGKESTVESNTISDCVEGGVIIRRAEDIVFNNNTIRRSSGTGLTVENSEGMVFNNMINDNHRGGLVKAGIMFFENTISSNNNGINIMSSSPYFDGNILSNNDNYGFRFEKSSSIIKRVSILNSRHHFYLINSNVTVIDSAFRDDRIYTDGSSDLDIQERFNASMDEGTSLRYEIYEYLPPSAEITGVYRTEEIDVDISYDSVYFFPDDYFCGTVNMIFNVTILNEYETKIPFTLEVNPVNNPPELRNMTVEVNYEPTRVRWEVIFEDKDGYLPTSVELIVDGDHYQMKEYNESNLDTFNGKKYYYEMYLEPGEHSYHIQATEDNPLGSNHTIQTQYYDLDISPPRSGWFGFSNRELASIVTLIMFLILLIVLIKNRKYRPEEDTESTEVVEEQFLNGMFQKLPVLNKKSKEGHEGKKSKSSTNKLPVLLKKDRDFEQETRYSFKARKSRVISNLLEQDEKDIVDSSEARVTDDKTDKGHETKSKQSKKQRVVKTKKRVRPKPRVIKDKKDTGRLKRVIKDD